MKKFRADILHPQRYLK